jgi:hypothetical protein
MATKKQRRTKATKAKQKKKNLRMFFLSVILTVSVAFLVFFFISLFNYIYPPTTGTDVSASKRPKHKVQLYFSDSNERFLTPVARYIPKRKSIKGQAEELAKAILEGPKQGLIRTFPDNVKLQNVDIKKNGTALISFDKNLIEAHPGGSTSELMTIYSLTNTLILNIPKIKKVKLLVDGKEIETIKGHISTRDAFSLNRELITPTST